MQRFIHSGLVIIATLSLLIATAREADADLKHRYNFTTDASDSVGDADGEVLDAGSTPNAVFTDGKLDLTANVGQGSNNITEDAYVNLPNGTISALGNSATFEVWTTVNTNRTWSQIFDFGRSAAGEDISTGGPGSKYVTLIPQAGAIALEVHITEVGVAGNPLIRPGALSTGVEHHLVTVIDAADTMGGANPDGTAYLYLDGSEVSRAPLYPGFALSGLDDINNWLGRSQWDDALYDGSYNEFRIYDDVITPEQVLVNAVIGPDQTAVAPPDGNILTLEVETTTGAVTLKNHLAATLTLSSYEITSAGDALSPSGWNSLDDQEMDAPGVGWDESGGSDPNELIEFFLGAAGGTIAPNAELSLGNAFDTSAFGSGNNGDLAFQFGLNSGTLLTGAVNYISDTVGVPGDYNENGIVDAADYTVWRDNFGSATALPNDDTAGVDQQDYTRWKNNFGNNGAGSGSGLESGAVPEPASLALFLAAGALVVGSRWRL